MITENDVIVTENTDDIILLYLEMTLFIQWRNDPISMPCYPSNIGETIINSCNENINVAYGQ